MTGFGRALLRADMPVPLSTNAVSCGTGISQILGIGFWVLGNGWSDHPLLNTQNLRNTGTARYRIRGKRRRHAHCRAHNVLKGDGKMDNGFWEVEDCISVGRGS